MKGLVKEAMQEAEAKARHYYNRIVRHHEHKEDDKIMLLQPCQRNELEAHWDGPATIKKKLSITTQ